MKTGIELIADERQRQIDKEGWTPEHDDSNRSGNMALAGACYACNAATMTQTATPEMMETYPKFSIQGFRWPFDRKWWKPKSPVEDLVRAGALIAAEIDRLQRKEARKNSSKNLGGDA
jgi:hypothetical protein